MSMSRKDFEAVAAILQSVALSMHVGRHEYLVGEFAEYLSTTNPGFDREVFVKACGIDTDPHPKYGRFTDADWLDSAGGWSGGWSGRGTAF